jgi:UDP-N-acetylglucosamine--N-acetylmuramyl-(pentapeptide) pyrophosphoryl-undecaprenol N-acetylglucosamine transferase
MKIILSGGGTLGPVTPLLAVAEAIKKAHPFCALLWVGTKHGPEKYLVQEAGINYKVISAGKLRRYFSAKNVFDLFSFGAGFIQSYKLLKKEKPDLLITAGGFVSVPLHLVASFLKIPTWVHQQDAMVGLANRIMATRATLVTTALEENISKIKLLGSRARWIGNPVRDMRRDPDVARKQFGISDNEPVILAMGGGTGAMRINQLVLEALPLLPKTCHMIHLVGIERSAETCVKAQEIFSNYRVYKFLGPEMAEAYATADVVVARGGFATLTELASLKKAAILIPISGTHQELNVKPFAKAEAVIELDEVVASGVLLAEKIKELVNAPDRCLLMGAKLGQVLPIASDETIIEIINSLVSVQD